MVGPGVVGRESKPPRDGPLCGCGHRDRPDLADLDWPASRRACVAVALAARARSNRQRRARTPRTGPHRHRRARPHDRTCRPTGNRWRKRRRRATVSRRYRLAASARVGVWCDRRDRAAASTSSPCVRHRDCGAGSRSRRASSGRFARSHRRPRPRRRCPRPRTRGHRTGRPVAAPSASPRAAPSRSQPPAPDRVAPHSAPGAADRAAAAGRAAPDEPARHGGASALPRSPHAVTPARPGATLLRPVGTAFPPRPGGPPPAAGGPPRAPPQSIAAGPRSRRRPRTSGRSTPGRRGGSPCPRASRSRSCPRRWRT